MSTLASHRASSSSPRCVPRPTLYPSADNVTRAWDGSLRAASRLAIVANTTHRNLLGSPSLTLFATEFLKSQ
jgi:hypothetical protein